MTQTECKIFIDDDLGETSVISNRSSDSTHLLILAHGAGTDMRHSFMNGLSRALVECGIATLRFNFPYKEQGRGRPDRKPVTSATIDAVVKFAMQESDLPLSLGGKSFGGRMMSHYLTEATHIPVKNLIFYGFPLHPAGKPGIDRAAHLPSIKQPMYFLQGDRDALSKVELIIPVVKDLPSATLEILPGADHGFKFLKSKNVSPDQALAILAQKTLHFIDK